ncbi:MAG: hypothetical protein R3F37_05225 [Candidatus Competibacteraceae bacterium]
MVVRYLVATTPSPPGRVVTLGTPHQTNQVARVLSNGKLRRVLGRSERGFGGRICRPGRRNEIGFDSRHAECRRG